MDTITSAVLISIAVKFAVGLWDYSGYHTPPMYGDQGEVSKGNDYISQ